MLTQKRKKKTTIDLTRVPKHIAIIMDGNGRWAKLRSLPRQAGHAAGCEVFRKIGLYCKEMGVKYLTVYAFSTENWKRPPEEVNSIMHLLKDYLNEAIEKMVRENIAIHVIGDLEGLPAELKDMIKKTEELSEFVTSGLNATLCVNYGGRSEILRAVRSIAKSSIEGVLNPEELDEDRFSGFLYTSSLPEPDLIIRTGGEMRVSNFLLWQCAYSEFYFTDVLWPDFNENEMNLAISEFQNRTRRFGGV